jgi:hypothetical protein
MIVARTLAPDRGANAAEVFDPRGRCRAGSAAALLPWPYFFARFVGHAAAGLPAHKQCGWSCTGAALVGGAAAAAVLRPNATNLRHGYVHAASGALGSLALLTARHCRRRRRESAALFGAGVAIVLGAAANCTKGRDAARFRARRRRAGRRGELACLGPTLLARPAAGRVAAGGLVRARARVGARRRRAARAGPVVRRERGSPAGDARRGGHVSDWGAKTLGWEPNATRWLLVVVPLFALAGWFLRERAGRARYARPLFHAASPPLFGRTGDRWIRASRNLCRSRRAGAGLADDHAAADRGRAGRFGLAGRKKRS